MLEPAAAADPAADDTPQLTAVYRERSALVTYLAAQYPSVIAPATDYPGSGWYVVYVEGPAGQMSWHFPPEDLPLFPDAIPHVPTWVWDGHSTEEKYGRLATLTHGRAPHDERGEEEPQPAE
ncbi:hypothetical protein ACIQU6_30645 [Streptomyces sp. NPDC090442]|uniref:WDGH domain-containing protein n=1 Tax=Streptomyces sp. NPDC090442 TaxID=3365962 RepID=UPI0038169E59